MKTQLIITRDQMVLVSDEHIKEGDWYFDPINIAVYQRNKDLIEEYYGCYKIIAGIPELPKIDNSELTERYINKICRANLDLVPVDKIMFDVVIEMELCVDPHLITQSSVKYFKPKITNNSIKVTKII